MHLQLYMNTLHQIIGNPWLLNHIKKPTDTVIYALLLNAEVRDSVPLSLSLPMFYTGGEN